MTTPLTIQVNEIFGPTIQGEGPDIGKPCMFLRLHNCPVHCPGCDTSYTWNGSEAGTKTPLDHIRTTINGLLTNNPGCGVVVSGGEPLLHYRNQAFRNLVHDWSTRAWTGLETSGYAGTIPQDGVDACLHFLEAFTTVTISPKVTPCLHGKQSDEELLSNIAMFTHIGEGPNVVFKFVVKDAEDVAVVERVDEEFGLSGNDFPIYLMPYGMERDEIIRVSDWLVPTLARTGYLLSPRLHSILWGPKRGV